MISSHDNNNYDVIVIVIGSGMGGSATASIVSQLGKKRVLMLERHFKLGGFTHSFRRKHYEWDIGAHLDIVPHRGHYHVIPHTTTHRHCFWWRKLPACVCISAGWLSSCSIGCDVNDFEYEHEHEKHRTEATYEGLKCPPRPQPDGVFWNKSYHNCRQPI